MGVAEWIIAGLGFALIAVSGIGAAILNAERRRHEREEKRIIQEGAANAQHTADIITEANKDKSEIRTGNHSHDLHTMADKLHNYANKGK